MNAANLLRQALAGLTASSGYQVTLDRLKLHSVQIQGDGLVVDFKSGLTVLYVAPSIGPIGWLAPQIRPCPCREASRTNPTFACMLPP